MKRLSACWAALACLATVLVSCSQHDSTSTDPGTRNPLPSLLTVSGHGSIVDRYTAEVWVHGNFAYTTTWGRRGAAQVPGNTIYVWDVSGADPLLVDSVQVSDAVTLGDVQVTDDGRLLVVPTELDPGSIVVFDLTDPARPRQLSRFLSPNIHRGVHTCEVQVVSGKLYAFLSVNQASDHPSRLLIVDLSDPANPREVMHRDLGRPFIHDVFVRDGFLFTALWNDGMVIWDIGGGGKGGTVENPIEIGRVVTKNGSVHNIYWFHDPVTGSRRYAFVGEEGPAGGFSSSSGDIHVVDVSDMANPREVAFYSVTGAGTHNFSADEARGFLYAAYYNGGVRVIDARGNLGSCTAAQKSADGRCNLDLMGRVRGIGLQDVNMSVFVWGVHVAGSFVYASDMLNGLWKLQLLNR